MQQAYLFWAISVSIFLISETTEVCQWQSFLNEHLNFHGSWLTDRPWFLYNQIIPTYTDWWTCNLDKKNIFEVGAGSGRALVELQSKHPKAIIKGSNYYFYFRQNNAENKQSDGSQKNLWEMAYAHNITVHCTENNTPILPQIIETKIGIQEGALPVDPETIDFLISRFSLGNGKVLPHDSHKPIIRAMEALAKGGTAVLHIGHSVSTDWKNQHSQESSVLRISNIQNPYPMSIVIQQQYVQSMPKLNDQVWAPYFFVIIIKKCQANHNRHPIHNDCILEHNTEYNVPHPTQKIEYRLDPYMKHYVHNINNWLSKWEKTNTISLQ